MPPFYSPILRWFQTTCPIHPHQISQQCPLYQIILSLGSPRLSLQTRETVMTLLRPPAATARLLPLTPRNPLEPPKGNLRAGPHTSTSNILYLVSTDMDYTGASATKPGRRNQETGRPRSVNSTHFGRLSRKTRRMYVFRPSELLSRSKSTQVRIKAVVRCVTASNHHTTDLFYFPNSSAPNSAGYRSPRPNAAIVHTIHVFYMSFHESTWIVVN